MTMLNLQQEMAVKTTSRITYVNAGAGTGKTTTLETRIKECLKSGVKPWNIIVLAFNKNIIEELKIKLTKEYGVKKTKLLKIYTIHAYALSIVKNNKNIQKPLFDEETCLQFIKDTWTKYKQQKRIESHNTKEARKKTDDIINMIKKCRENHKLLSEYPEQYQEYYKYFIKELKRCNAYDFARIIKVAISYFTQHREILYIFVDEFQDTSQTRFNFIKALVGKANYLFAVGDEDQQILEWSGVKNNNVKKLKNLYPKEFTEYKLEESYRLTPQIAQISNTLLNLLPDRKPKNLRGCNNNHGIVKIKKFTNIKAETDWCVKYIKKLIKKGIPPQNIGVLSRKSDMLDDEIKKTKVHCSTIHKAKGLEFDYIILLGLEEGTFSYSNNNIEEEIRLLNVAITRSKGNLIITYIQDGYRNNMYVKKSRFLNYIKKSLQ